MATRRERVILDLQDDFTPGMARAAAAAALLNRELNSLSGNSVQASRSSQVFVRDVQKMGKEADGAGAKIDRLSGRIGMAADALLLLGPAAIPIGALAVPAVMLLTSSLAALAVGAGTTAIAFGGVGDAISAANKAHLEPTVENLAAAEELFSKLAPAVEEFSKQFNSMRGLGAEIRNAGAEALFPGLTEALESLESRGPEAIRIMTVFNETVGDNAADAAASLASDKWSDFFALIEREGPPTLDKTADALGDVAHGVSELLEAFAPMTADGMDWLVDGAEGFDKWATGLKKTEGFKEFTDYIRENGPQVVDTLTALSRALLDILEAAAPLGGPALKGIESFANAVSAVADSDLATPLLAAITAMRAINRLAPATAGSLALLSGGGAAGAAGGKRGKPGKSGRGGGAGAGALAFFGATIAADLLAAELGWEEATDRQRDKGEEFVKQWGATLSEQAESARVKLSELLDVTTGKGPFGLLANDEGLSEALLNAPLKKQLELRKQLREEYGVGLKQLEEHGILLKGTTRHFEHQREQVGGLKRLLKEPLRLDVDDKPAKRKLKEAGNGLDLWGKKDVKATVDADSRPARDKLSRVDRDLAHTDDTTAVPEIDINDGNSRGIMAAVRAEMARIDGTVATTYINTVRTVTGPKGGAAFSQEAYGDVKDRHNPEIAAGGSWRVWAEPETQGESYIPHANDGRRPRARAILEETASILGARSVEWFGGGGNSESEAAKKAREKREEARERAAERERREEEKRQRQLDKQRTKDLLASNLRDEREQARLEVQDARRRLKSARGADRPKGEINEARLALKGERADMKDLREQARHEREEERIEAKEKADAELQRLEEERLEAERERADAIFDGQQRAWDIVTDSAQSNVDAAKSVLDGVNASMERIGKAATSMFESNWFAGGGREQQHGLWTGANTSAAGDWRSQALGDIKGLEERQALIAQLSGQGLTGAALENLLGDQSNAGIAAMLAAGDIDDYAALFAQREALTGQVAAAAGRAGWGAEQATATAALAVVSEQLAAVVAAIQTARVANFTVNESISAAATAAEVARLQAMYGVS